MFVFTLIPKPATLRKTSKHSIDCGVYYLRARGKLSCKRAVILFRPKGDGNTILKAKLMLPFENLNLHRTGKSVDLSFHIITAGNFGSFASQIAVMHEMKFTNDLQNDYN